MRKSLRGSCLSVRFLARITKSVKSVVEFADLFESADKMELFEPAETMVGIRTPQEIRNLKTNFRAHSGKKRGKLSKTMGIQI